MSLTTTRIVICCFIAIGAITVFGNALPGPAFANGGEGRTTIILEAATGSLETTGNFVALLDDEREEEDRSPEAEAGPRRSAEREGRRRSPEAKSKTRRSAEGEGQRRSPEAEGRRPRAAEGDREDRNPLAGFRPQTQREAALFQMIQQLQREVAALRRAVDSQKGARPDGAASRDGERSSFAPRDTADSVVSSGWERTKAGGVFRAYDKDRDMFVTLDEWLAMTNGNISDARRKLQTQRFHEARPGRDGKMSPAEFIDWWNHREGASRDRRDGEGSQRGPRDGERERRDPRDGEDSAEPKSREGERHSDERP